MYKIRVGISACLLGQEVRFDGATSVPASASGISVPTLTITPSVPKWPLAWGAPRRHPAGEAPRRDPRRGEQWQLRRHRPAHCLQRAEGASARFHLRLHPLCQIPSCGMERVRIYGANNEGSAKEGIGLFAKALMEANPLLPVEEDGRLCDPILRENFVLRVFAYHDWQQLCARGITASALIRFHSRYKYLVLSHATSHYRALGKLLGNLAKADLQQVADSYIKGLMAALTLRANRRSHTNVLMHLQGYFKRVLTPAQKQELCDTIDKYRTGVFPLLVPLTLIRHYLREYPNPYLAEQVYLNPHPDTLKLRYGL